MSTPERYSAEQRGFTIVELMVAMLISLMIAAGALTLFTQVSRSHEQDQRITSLIEHGRFALKTIMQDLTMADFWGEMIDPTSVTTALVAGEDCGIALLSGTDAMQYNNNHPGMASVQFNNNSGGCPGLTGTVRPGTDLLAVKRVSGTGVTAGQTDGIVYLRTNGVTGSLINDAGSTALPATFRDWMYLPRIYYVRDGGLPMLCRLTLVNTAFGAVAADGCLAEGIEDLHLQFGVDTDTDGVANQYVSNPTAAQIGDAVSARVYLLVRAATGDFTYTDTKQYVLGDVVVGPFNDNLHRRVFSTTVQLRNPTNAIQLR
jgi:type IV pilus assembly protein PilW